MGYLYIGERMERLDPPLDDIAVAKLCEVYRETVVRWRSQERRPKPEKMPLLAAALKCTMLDLYLPPGKMAVIVDIAGEMAKRGDRDEKPSDSRPVRPSRRVRQ